MAGRQDVALRDVRVRAAVALVAAALTGNLGWVPAGRAAAHAPETRAAASSRGSTGEGPLRYQVRYGDTLGALARRYGVSVRAIAGANGIPNPDRIVAGQVLVIPGRDAARSTAPASPASARPGAVPLQPAAQARGRDQTPPGTGPATSSGDPAAAGDGGTAGKRPDDIARPAFAVRPAALLFEGPDGIRVQVYGTLAPPAVPAPALPGPDPAEPVLAPGLVLRGILPTGPAAEPAPGLAPADHRAGARPDTAPAPAEEPLFSLPLPPGQRVVALTFNDLPDGGTLPLLVRALDAAGGHATFFVSGAVTRRSRNQILELLALGHEVGIQGMEAEDLTALGAEQVAASLAAARQALLEVGAPPPRFFRPPLGRFDDRVLAAARRLGLETVMWSSIGLRDLDDPGPDLLSEQARGAAFPGAILMLHADRPATAAALPAVLAALGQDGYRVVSLSELLARTSEVAGSVP